MSEVGEVMSDANIDPIFLHDEICDKCKVLKPCMQGFRQVGNEQPEVIFECPECTKRIREEYEARLVRSQEAQ